MRVETALYDPAEFLTDEEGIAGYLRLAREGNDTLVIAKAQETVKRARLLNKSIIQEAIKPL
jgi:DNA-binding phage protein